MKQRFAFIPYIYVCVCVSIQFINQVDHLFLYPNYKC